MSLSKQNDLPYSFKTSGNRIQAWPIQSFYICSFYFERLQRTDTIRKVIGLMNRRWGHGRRTGVSYVLLKARWRWVGERTLCYTNWHHSNRRRPQGLLPSPHTHSWWRRKNRDTSSSSPCERSDQLTNQSENISNWTLLLTLVRLFLLWFLLKKQLSGVITVASHNQKMHFFRY